MTHPWCSRCPYRPSDGGACPRAVAGSTWCRWGDGRFQVCPSSGADKGGQGSVCDAVFNGVPVKVKWTETGSYDIAQSYRGEVAALRLLADTGTVPRVFSDVEEDPLPNGKRAVFYAMETAPGAPWGDGRGRLAFGRAYRLPLFRLVECMLRMHERRVSHLDLKPQNLFFDPAGGRVTVIDFGTAKGAGRISRATGFGVDPYLPLEQQVGDILWPTVGETSDDFACGVLFVQAVMGLSTSDLDTKYMEAMPHPRFPGRTIKRYTDKARSAFRRELERATRSADVARLVVDGLLADKPFDSATGRETAPDPRKGVLLRVRDELARLGWGESVPPPPPPLWPVLLLGVVLCGVVGGVVAWVNRAGGSSDVPTVPVPGPVVGEKTDKDAKQPQSLKETYDGLLGQKDGRAKVLSQMKLDWDNTDLRQEIWEYYCANATLLPVLDVPTNLNFSSHSNGFAGVFQGHVSSKDNRLFFVPNKDKIPATNVSEAVGSLNLRVSSSGALKEEQDCDQCTKTIRVSVPLFGDPSLKDVECELEERPQVSVQVKISGATVQYVTGRATAKILTLDENGKGTFSVPPHERVEIHISADGYKSQTRRLGPLHRGQDETVEISLVRGSETPQENPWTTLTSEWDRWCREGKTRLVLENMSTIWPTAVEEGRKAIWAFYCAHRDLWPRLAVDSVVAGTPSSSSSLFSFRKQSGTDDWVLEPSERTVPGPMELSVSVEVPFRAGTESCTTCDQTVSATVSLFASDVTKVSRPVFRWPRHSLSVRTDGTVSGETRIQWRYADQPEGTESEWNGEEQAFDPHRDMEIRVARDGYQSLSKKFSTGHCGAREPWTVELERDASVRTEITDLNFTPPSERDFLFRFENASQLAVMDKGGNGMKWKLPPEKDRVMSESVSDEHTVDLNLAASIQKDEEEDMRALWDALGPYVTTMRIGSVDGDGRSVDGEVKASVDKDVSLSLREALAPGERIQFQSAFAMTKDECKDAWLRWVQSRKPDAQAKLDLLDALVRYRPIWTNVCEKLYEEDDSLTTKIIEFENMPYGASVSYGLQTAKAGGKLRCYRVPMSGQRISLSVHPADEDCYEPTTKDVVVRWDAMTTPVSFGGVSFQSKSGPTWAPSDDDRFKGATVRYRSKDSENWSLLVGSDSVSLRPHTRYMVEVTKRNSRIAYSMTTDHCNTPPSLTETERKSIVDPPPEQVLKWLKELQGETIRPVPDNLRAQLGLSSDATPFEVLSALAKNTEAYAALRSDVEAVLKQASNFRKIVSDFYGSQIARFYGKDTYKRRAKDLFAMQGSGNYNPKFHFLVFLHGGSDAAIDALDKLNDTEKTRIKDFISNYTQQ